MRCISKALLILLVPALLLGVVLFFPEGIGCDVYSVLLRPEAMPDGWVFEDSYSPPVMEDYWAQDAESIAFGLAGLSQKAHHTVYRYRNRVQASLFLRFEQELLIPSTHWTWSPMAGSDTWALGGDWKLVECRVSDGDYSFPRCTAVVRYGAWISDVSSLMGPGIMSEEQFKRWC